MREEKRGVGRGARRNFRMSLFGPPQSSAPALVLKGRGKRRRDGMGRPLEKKRRRGEGAGALYGSDFCDERRRRERERKTGVLRRKILGKERGGDPPAQRMTAAISPSTMQGSLFSPLPLSYISHSEQGREGPPSPKPSVRNRLQSSRRRRRRRVCRGVLLR